MKKFKSIGIRLLAFSFLAIFLAFKPGGEGYEIYLGDQLLLQNFNHNSTEIKNLALSSSEVDANLVVKYYHCGRTGKDRVISLKDGNDNLLKQFRFPDGGTHNTAMSFRAAEVTGYNKQFGTVRLYYSSKELTKERLLAAFGQ